MTLNLLARRCAVALAIVASSFTAAQAQPSAAGTVSPPVRADIALSGKVLAGHNTGDHLACQNACKSTAGCSGYSFNRNAKASCTVLGGGLADVAVTGAVSCRMPCEASPAKTALAQPAPGALLRTPDATKSAAAMPLPTTVPPPARPLQMTPSLAAPMPLVAIAPVPPPPDPNAKAPRAAPPPAPAPPAPTKAPAARTGVAGYEVVQGPEVNVAPLAHTLASAQCPAGKVALSAGYSFTAVGDASFGLEVRGAIPEGRAANVWVRNANVVDAAKARAIAVCVNEIVGLRAVDSWTESLDDRGNPSHLACAGRERLVGGGVMAGNDTHITANAPQPWGDPGTWLVTVIRSSPLAGQDRIRTRALCAPEAAVDGWEVIQTAPVGLGGRTQRMLLQTCPGGKVLLSGGVLQRGGPPLDMVVNTLGPQGAIAWSTHVHNRNMAGASSQITVVFAAVCARRQ